MYALAKAPIAFDHRIGCIDAVDDDGHARPARNDDIEASPAQAGIAVPIKIASAIAARIPVPISGVNLAQCPNQGLRPPAKLPVSLTRKPARSLNCS